MFCEQKANIKNYKVHGHTANRNCKVADPSVEIKDLF
jgi:hypothetical protein